MGYRGFRIQGFGMRFGVKIPVGIGATNTVHFLEFLLGGIASGKLYNWQTSNCNRRYSCDGQLKPREKLENVLARIAEMGVELLFAPTYSPDSTRSKQNVMGVLIMYGSKNRA